MSSDQSLQETYGSRRTLGNADRSVVLGRAEIDSITEEGINERPDNEAEGSLDDHDAALDSDGVRKGLCADESATGSSQPGCEQKSLPREWACRGSLPWVNYE